MGNYQHRQFAITQYIVLGISLEIFEHKQNECTQVFSSLFNPQPIYVRKRMSRMKLNLA